MWNVHFLPCVSWTSFKILLNSHAQLSAGVLPNIVAAQNNFVPFLTHKTTFAQRDWVQPFQNVKTQLQRQALEVVSFYEYFEFCGQETELFRSTDVYYTFNRRIFLNIWQSSKSIAECFQPECEPSFFHVCFDSNYAQSRSVEFCAQPLDREWASLVTRAFSKWRLIGENEATLVRVDFNLNHVCRFEFFDRFQREMPAKGTWSNNKCY